jgi:hypothetical protein
MKYIWNTGQQVVFLPPARVRETLIEYDGPQLCIVERGSDEFVSLRVDEDDKGVRWLQSPITSVEYEALISGELALRSALLKPEMLLVEDSHDEETFRTTQVDPAKIPDAYLPKPGARLPAYVRASYASQLRPEVPAEFHLATKGVHGRGIAFSRLSAVTGTIQHLWNSLATTMNAPSLPLNAIGSGDGSFKLTVEVRDRALLAKVASAYRDLTRATYDEYTLGGTFSKSPQAVTQNYSHLLRALDLNQVDVLTNWRADGEEHIAFVGYAGAQRTRKAISATITSDQVIRRPLTLTGYLEGFAGRKRYFDFFDPETAKHISGKMQKKLRDFPLHDELRLGHRRKYRVEIESVESPGQEPQYTLMDFAPVED